MMVFLHKNELLTMYHGWVLVSSQRDSRWQRIKHLVVVKDEKPLRLRSIFLQIGPFNIDLFSTLMSPKFLV